MYKDYYQLKAMPFNMSPDPRFFYASKGHNKALSYLKYGIAQGEGFIVITGGIGTGKTTVIKNLLTQLDSKVYIARQIVSTFLKEDELIESVCHAYGIAGQNLSKVALLERLKKFLVLAYRQNKKVLLIVDEAQNLPLKTVEELRMLSNYQIGNKPLLQSFLVGQKEFVITLQSDKMEQLRQRVIASSHLSSLSADETKQYVEYRLQQAGWEKKCLFSPKALELIHQVSEGIPRRINLLCDRVLLFGYLEELEYFDATEIHSVIDELSQEIANPIKKNNKQTLLAKSKDKKKIKSNQNKKAKNAVNNNKPLIKTVSQTSEPKRENRSKIEPISNHRLTEQDNVSSEMDRQLRQFEKSLERTV